VCIKLETGDVNKATNKVMNKEKELPSLRRPSALKCLLAGPSSLAPSIGRFVVVLRCGSTMLSPNAPLLLASVVSGPWPEQLQ
jgi:hypothetical protein